VLHLLWRGVGPQQRVLDVVGKAHRREG
jgi:hypothetical protein